MPLPMGAEAAARQIYTSAQARGGGHDDWTSILEAVRRLAGLS